MKKAEEIIRKLELPSYRVVFAQILTGVLTAGGQKLD